MTALRSNLPCSVALVLAAAAACAGDIAQPAPPATGDDSFFERATLTDDWFGTGPTIREHGIHFAGAITQFFQGLAAGDGPHGCEYGGKVDGFLRIDGGKLGLWKGFGVHAHGELNYGQQRTGAGGTFACAFDAPADRR